MKTMTKAEFIAKIESELPDDAQIVGYSDMAGEAFELDDTGDVFTPIQNMRNDDFELDIPAEVTHLFWVS